MRNSLQGSSRTTDRRSCYEVCNCMQKCCICGKSKVSFHYVWIIYKICAKFNWTFASFKTLIFNKSCSNSNAIKWKINWFGLILFWQFWYNFTGEERRADVWCFYANCGHGHLIVGGHSQARRIQIYLMGAGKTFKTTERWNLTK